MGALQLGSELCFSAHLASLAFAKRFNLSAFEGLKNFPIYAIILHHQILSLPCKLRTETCQSGKTFSIDVILAFLTIYDEEIPGNYFKA